MLYVCTQPASLTSAAGPATQPTRQPIIRCAFDIEPTITVRSSMPSTSSGPTGARPSNSSASIAAS